MTIQQMVVTTLPQVVTSNLAVWLDARGYSGSGTTWPKYTGGNNSTLVNTPTYTSTGPTYFSFSPASAEEATLPALSSLTSWTIDTWFRVTSSLTGQVCSVVCDQYNGSSALNFSLGTNNSPTDYKIRMGFFNGAWQNATGFTPTLNTWYHFVGTYDGTTLNEYINSSLNSTATSLGSSSTGGTGIRIARRWDDVTTSTNYFPGDIAIVRIYSSAITAAQVIQNYTAEKSRFGI